MSGVFGGSSAAISALTGGDDGFIPKGVDKTAYDGLAQSIGAVVSLLPNSQVKCRHIFNLNADNIFNFSSSPMKFLSQLLLRTTLLLTSWSCSMTLTPISLLV